MVAVAPVSYNVKDTRPPKTLGMTKINTRKLHPNARAKGGKVECKEPSREEEEEICAPPVGSSDEDDGRSQAKTRSCSPSAGLERASHPVTSLQRGNQSRQCEHVEDELPSSFEGQMKRSQKRVNTYARKPNIHEHPPKRRSQESQSSQTSSGPQNDKKGGRSFNMPPTKIITSKSNCAWDSSIIRLIFRSTLTSSRAVCLSSTA